MKIRYALGLALASLFPASVASHDAPTGWSYGSNCCSNYDCRPVAAAPGDPHHTIWVEELRGGYVIHFPDGREEPVRHDSPKLKLSQDDGYHVCTSQGKDDGRLICLYVPDRGT